MTKLGMNPWLKMWTKPRETVKSIVKVDPNYRLWWLAGVYGFPMLLNIAQSLSLSTKAAPLWILLGAAIAAAFVGMVGFQITSGLVHWTGKWLGGQGNFLQIRTAVAWANVTNVVTSLLWIILVAMFGADVFIKTFPEGPVVAAGLAIARTLIFVLMTVLSVWSFVLLVRSLAEVQQFSVWRAIVNIILPFLIVTVALWAFFVFVCWAVGMKS